MGKDRGGGGGKQKLRPPNGPDSPALPYSSSQPERVEPTASTSHSKPPNFIPNPKKPRNPNWVSRNRRGPLVKQQFVKKSEVGSSNDQVGSGRIVETATGQQEEHEEKEEEEEKERIAIGVGVAGEDVGASESRKSHEDDDYDVVSRLEELQLGVQEPELSDEQLRITDQAQADEVI